MKYYPGSENDTAKTSPEMSNPNTMDKKWRGAGGKSKVRQEKVVIKDTATGKKYGSRTVAQKTTEAVSFSQFLQLEEGSTDITTIPEILLKEIKKNIRDGAQAVDQKWKNALELVNKAYQVANVRLPLPDQKGAWRQYEDMIQYGVKQLADARGLDGDWRTTDLSIREAVDVFDLDGSGSDTPGTLQSTDADMGDIGNKRIFADIAGVGQIEVNAKDFDECIEKLENHLRSKGARLRIKERSDKRATIDVLVKSADGEWKKRDEITLTEYS